MKFTCLSGNPSSPCNVLQFKSTMIMFDCSLDQLSTLSFLPLSLVHSNHFSSLSSFNCTKELNDSHLENELKECSGKLFVDSSPEFAVPELSCINMKHLDVILISNYRSMLALPYITERTEFAGLVYATEPSINIGRLYMEELVTYIERNPKLKRASAWKKYNVASFVSMPCFAECAPPQNWETIYTIQEINNCLSKVKPVSFSEKISIFGSFEAFAVSSGYCIGSCNWVIESAHEKVAYVSNSSSFTSHSRLLNTAPLKDADVVMVNSLSLAPHTSPNQKISECCSFIEKTLKMGGNVLIPTYSSGGIYDLFEFIITSLDRVGLGSVPIFFISPVAEHSLAYSNILAEWLSDEKQKHVYIPEEPFTHSAYIRNERLKHFSSISEENFNMDYRTPCIVFTGHPSLRFGDVVHFIELWGSSPNNLILFTEPDFPWNESLAPYQPLAMKVAYCPIVMNLSFIQANKLLGEKVQPSNLLLPYIYTKEGLASINIYGNRSVPEMPLEVDCNMISYKRKDVIELPIKCAYERLYISPELAAQIHPVQIKPGISIASVTGILETMDNNFRLCPITKTFQMEMNDLSPTKTMPLNFYQFGKVDIHKLLNLLAKAGIQDVYTDNSKDDCVYIRVNSKKTVIEITDATTTIITEQAELNSRFQFTQLVKQCLHRI